MRWKDLDFKLRAELIKLGVLSGIRDINLIRLLYDEQLDTVSDVLYLNNKVSLEQLATEIYDKENNYKTPLDSLNDLELVIEEIQLEIAIEQIKAEQPEQFKRDRLGIRINERPVPAMMDSSRVREDLSQRYDDIRKRVLSYKKYRAYGGYTDDPPFLQRILNNDNRSVVDWKNGKQKATHKLSYAQTPEGYIVYPEVQEVNGELHDFTDPKYKHGKWDALDNAIRNNDTLRFSNELDALKYTQEYKLKYPEYFKQFDKGGYLSNTPIGHKVKKYAKGGFENPDEPPVSESTYLLQPTLNIYELELLNYLLSNPTTEQLYLRNLAILNMTNPKSNLGIILTKEEQNLVDKTFLRYNNFRYSHPWAEGLNYTPIIGDGMDLISLAGAVNNKDYMTAGLGLGMLVLPNFIEKPIKKYKRQRNFIRNYPNMTFDEIEETARKIALKKYPDLSKDFDRSAMEMVRDQYLSMAEPILEKYVIPIKNKYKNKLSEEQFKEVSLLLEYSPEYAMYLLENNYPDPLKNSTVESFLLRLSKSTRGVYTEGSDLASAKEYLSEAPKEAKGGDRLNTKGLYTSNSDDIADVFMRALNNENLYNSYIGTLEYPFNYNINLSNYENIKNYRNKIDNFYSVFKDFDNSTDYKIPGSIAKEAYYTRSNGNNLYNIYERSYYPNSNINILNVKDYGLGNLNKHGRWGTIDTNPSLELFIPKQLNLSYEDFLKYMRVHLKKGNLRSKDPNTFKRDMEIYNAMDVLRDTERKRREVLVKAIDKYDKFDKKLKTYSQLGTLLTVPLYTFGAISFLINKSNENSPNKSKMSVEELENYNNLLLEVHKKTGIRKDRLNKYSIELLQSFLQ